MAEPLRAKLRRALFEFFSDGELSDFALDYFPQVYNNFGERMEKKQKARMVVAHCLRHKRIPDLTAALERERPHLSFDAAPSPAQTAPKSTPPPPERNDRQIFLSHASQDNEFAYRLAEDLREHGWQIWMAPDSIRPGEKWVEAIERGLAESGIFLLVITPAAVESGWVRDEADIAVNLKNQGKITFVSVKLQETDNVPYFWTVTQWASFLGEYEVGLAELLLALQPERSAQLERADRRFRKAITEEDWQTALAAGEKIQELHPDYKDTRRLLARVQEKVEQERMRQEEAARLYTQLQAAHDAGEWERALDLAGRIAKIVPDYRDVAALKEAARREQEEERERERRRKRRAKVERLYREMEAADAAGRWDEVIALAAQIEELAPGYRDVAALAAKARRERRRRLWAAPLARLQRLFQRLGRWGWVALLAPLLLLGVWVIIVGGDGDREEERALTATAAAIAQLPTATNTPTPSPEATTTNTPEPAQTTTATTTPPPTQTPTPSPTSTANLPPPNPEAGESRTRPADGMEMVYVPAGEFMMGSEEGEDDEQPVHAVAVDGYWIDRTEVTNAQFAQFVTETDYETTAEQEGSGYIYVDGEWGWVDGADWRHPFGPDSDLAGRDEHPVVLVSWSDANAYCEWAGGRLPTEAEWEKAARWDEEAQEARVYPWGDTFDGTRLNFCDSNCPFDWQDDSVDDGYEYTAPVGSYPDGASYYGALDMAGNVLEWTGSAYEPYPYDPDDGRENMTRTDVRPVLRGGSWNIDVNFVRAAIRNDLDPAVRSFIVGFRCAQE